jgi:hypothetical protein
MCRNCRADRWSRHDAQRHQPPRGPEDALGQEPDDVVPAVEPGRQQRRREPGVLGQQRDQRRDVGPFPGGDEGRYQLALPVRAQSGQLDLLAAPAPARRRPCGSAAGRSGESTRRRRSATRRQAFVQIRYSQVRSELRPAKPDSPFHGRG